MGYLQVGPLEHGICRYGRMLALGSGSREDVAIIERNVLLEGDEKQNRIRLREAARALSAADIVHAQVSVYCEGTWGAGWRSLAHLRQFRRDCGRPLVITLHDANGFEIPRARRLVRLLAKIGLETIRPQTPSAVDSVAPFFVARWVIRHAALTLVLTQVERSRLRSMQDRHALGVIPHFVETGSLRSWQVGPTSAGRKTIILPGFIFRGKGHGLMLEAMRELPDVSVVFLGGPSLGGTAEHSRVVRLAEQLGVTDRLKITGYLPEADYQQYLMTADLAVCPFEETKSASSSIASLIAAGCPILASDIPLISEYNAIAPGAIHTFRPYTPEALARTIRSILGLPRSALARDLPTLQRVLALPRVYDRHVDAYRQVLGLVDS